MELTLNFSTNKLTRCRKCKGELLPQYDKKTCHACLTKEKERDVARRQKRKFEDIENIVPGDLPAKVAKKNLQVKKVSNSHIERSRKTSDEQRDASRHQMSSSTQRKTSSRNSGLHLRSPPAG